MSGLTNYIAALSQHSPWLFALGVTLLMGLSGLILKAIIDGLFKLGRRTRGEAI